MRHQDRHRCLLQHAARRAAKHQLPQAAVAVAAHHQQIGAQLVRRGEEALADLDVAELHQMGLGGNAVPPQVGRKLDRVGLPAILQHRDH